MNTLNNNYQNISNQNNQNNNNENMPKLNNIDISKSHSMQINSTLLKDLKNNNINNQSNENLDKNINRRSLDFYALGKVDNYHKVTQFVPPNNGFRSTSNNLIKRNYFSINNRHFDDLKNVNPKKQATIYEQNVNENNYLTPFSVFNSFQRYDLPSNVVNQETYNIAKEKLYAKDIFSTIRKGQHLSRNDYFAQKQNLIGNNEKQNIEQNSKSINGGNIKELKRYNSSINIKENDRDMKNDIINKELIESKKLIHSSSTKAFIPKNPKDFTKEVLKNNITHFDKNYTNIVRDRNWWKVNK